MNEFREPDRSSSGAGFIINAGAVIALLLGIPGVFMGIFGAFGFLTGEKFIAGGLGALWGYMVVVGAYELNRRKFDWPRGRAQKDWHLLAGTLAVSTGLVVSGAMQESAAALAIVSALSAIKQANDGHDTKRLALIHVSILIAGIAGGIWFYGNHVFGKDLLDRVAALP